MLLNATFGPAVAAHAGANHHHHHHHHGRLPLQDMVMRSGTCTSFSAACLQALLNAGIVNKSLTVLEVSRCCLLTSERSIPAWHQMQLTSCESWWT